MQTQGKAEKPPSPIAPDQHSDGGTLCGKSTRLQPSSDGSGAPTRQLFCHGMCRLHNARLVRPPVPARWQRSRGVAHAVSARSPPRLHVRPCTRADILRSHAHGRRAVQRGDMLVARLETNVGLNEVGRPLALAADAMGSTCYLTTPTPMFWPGTRGRPRPLKYGSRARCRSSRGTCRWPRSSSSP